MDLLHVKDKIGLGLAEWVLVLVEIGSEPCGWKCLGAGSRTMVPAHSLLQRLTNLIVLASRLCFDAMRTDVVATRRYCDLATSTIISNKTERTFVTAQGVMSTRHPLTESAGKVSAFFPTGMIRNQHVGDLDHRRKKDLRVHAIIHRIDSKWVPCGSVLPTTISKQVKDTRALGSLADYSSWSMLLMAGKQT